MKKLNDLSKEEKRILAAEACGYKWFTDALGHRILSPDYGNDLNAMHEAIRHAKANSDQFFTMDYHKALCRAVLGRDPSGSDSIFCGGHILDWMVEATAAQRLDAFLLAKNLAE